MSRLELFKELSNFDASTNQSRIVHKSEFIGKYQGLQFENGGSWCRKEVLKNYIMAKMYSNGELSLNIDDPELYETTKTEMEDYMEKRFPNHLYKSRKTILFKICGMKDKYILRPIRPSIYKFFQNSKCCHCGSKDIVIDHKNYLYNDPRVLNTKTQTVDDFQPLCNSCNLKKRGDCIKMRKTGKRIPATEIIGVWANGVDFISGDDSFDITNPNTLVGYYWYDVLQFKEHLFKMAEKKGYQKGYVSAVKTDLSNINYHVQLS